MDASGITFDTVQFLATESGAWRIRTYATDQDVHVWLIDATVHDIVKLAHRNTEEHYGGVISVSHIIETSDGVDGLRHELRERGLSDHLETSKAGFMFWAAEGTRYRSRSAPRDDS